MTKADIDKGRPGSAEYCPVARAAARCIPDNYQIIITRTKIGVFYGSKKGWNYYILSSDVQQKIENFDLFGKMDPFDFKLNV